MGQIIINTGNVANDGLGTPLRNAFDQVNYNFTQLFNAGPSGSNIVIANNSITVTNTNGNLRLATNGVGSIVPAANFVPDVPNVRSIGAGTNRFNTVYAQYINANTGTFAGNVYVAGNLQVTGNVITVNYSNLSVANSNITLATGAANAAQANGGGVLIPIADANFTYDYSANSWNSTIAITAPTFIGDGANLTNVIANVQANALLGNTFSNTVNYSNLTSFGLVSALSITGNVSTTGNVYANAIVGNRVTANYLYGNGSNITNITANAIVGNVPFALVANTAYVANLAALATQAINADTALFAINANLASFANTATIAQTANAATYAVQADNANSAVVAGMAYQLSPTANLSVTGNITTGGYFLGDGGLISNILVTTTYANSNVAAYLPTDNTIISIQSNISNNSSNITTLQGQVYANSNVSTYLQALTSNISTTGNITASYFFGNGSQLTGIAANYGNANVVANLAALGSNPISTTGNVTASYFVGNGSLLTGIATSSYGNANVVANLAALGSNPISTTGNITANYFVGNGSQLTGITSNYGNANVVANLAALGSNPISTTGNITANYFVGNGSQLTGITANTGNITFNGDNIGSSSNTVNIIGNTYAGLESSNNYIWVEQSQAEIQVNAYGWTFYDNAVLGLANGANISQTTDDNTGQKTFNITPASSSNFEVLLDDGNAKIQTGNGIITNNWIFENDGNLVLPSNTSSINYANGSPYGGGGSANTGNVTFSDQIVIGTGDSYGGGGLYLAAGNTEIGNLQYLRVRGGDYPTHIHFDTGNVEYYDQYFGDDNKYVKLEAGYTGNIVIGTDDDNGNRYIWTHDSTGNLTVPGNIKSITTGFSFTSNVANVDTTTGNVYIELVDTVFGASEKGQVIITDIVGTTEANGTWYFEAVEANQFQLFYSPNATNPVDGTGWPAYVSGGLAVAAGYNNLSITGGNVSIATNDGNVWAFNSNGTTTFPTANIDLHNGGVQSGEILQFGNPNLQAIITGPTPSANVSAQRLIIQGQRGNGTGEGGDVYVWGGDADTNGGDIKIYAGDADNVSAGTGGYVNIDGGDGFDQGGAVTIDGGISANGPGGQVSMTGGSGELNGGYASLQGGFSANGQGGAVQIAGGGSGNGQGSYGNIEIGTGTYVWLFNNSGNLVLPGNTFAVNYANGTQVSIGGGGANTGNVTFDDINVIGTGNLKLQPDSANASAYLDIFLTGGPDIHIAGNGETVILGTDDFANVTVNIDGNVSIQSGDANGTHTWNFDTTGSLNLPTIELDVGNTINEQTVIQSQRKIIPGLRYSAEIVGTTPTVVYTATSIDTTSMKVTMQIQHTGLGFEFFDVSATSTGGNTFYTVSNRVQPPTISNSTVVVDLNGSNTMDITVTINSGAANSWVTYDATEFGIAVD